MACDGLFVIVILLVIVIAVRHAVWGLQNGDYEYDYEYDHETAHTAGHSIGLANVRRLFMNDPGYSPPSRNMNGAVDQGWQRVSRSSPRKPSQVVVASPSSMGRHSRLMSSTASASRPAMRRAGRK